MSSHGAIRRRCKRRVSPRAGEVVAIDHNVVDDTVRRIVVGRVFVRHLVVLSTREVVVAGSKHLAQIVIIKDVVVDRVQALRMVQDRQVGKLDAFLVFVVCGSVRLRLVLFLLVRLSLFFMAQRRSLIGLNESIVVNLERLQPWQGLLSRRHVFDVLIDGGLDGSFNRGWVGAGSRHCLHKSLLLDSFRWSPSSQSRPRGAALPWLVFRDTTLGFTFRRSLMGSLMRRPDLV